MCIVQLNIPYVARSMLYAYSHSFDGDFFIIIYKLVSTTTFAIL